MRLVIHAGFGKCGSSAIQTALAAKQSELKRQSIFLFGKGLSINYGRPRADVPFWTVTSVFRNPGERAAVPARLPRELAQFRSAAPDGTAILSAEILGKPGFAPLFKGIDGICETIVVFYIRPQYEWIPSPGSSGS